MGLGTRILGAMPWGQGFLELHALGSGIPGSVLSIWKMLIHFLDTVVLISFGRVKSRFNYFLVVLNLFLFIFCLRSSFSSTKKKEDETPIEKKIRSSVLE